jgi:hypothetical protein
MIRGQDIEKIVFSVTAGDIQQESVRLIGRKLSDEELDKAVDGIDWGLSFGIDTVFRTAINEAVL